MYRVETHDNSSEYFSNITLDNCSLHICATTSFSNMIKELGKVDEQGKWRICDIENLIECIYKDWSNILNNLKIKGEVRKIIRDLNLEIKDNNIKTELKYFEDNIDILISDIKYLAETNISNINFSEKSTTKELFKMIYDRLLETEVFKEISGEILNIIKAANFYSDLEGYNGGEVKRIYFYNINNLDLRRYLIITLLKTAGFEIIFRIPYFENCKALNRCWEAIYKDDSLFNIEINKSIKEKSIDSKYINFLEGKRNTNDTNENVITKTYSEVSDFKKELKDKQLITFYKDSLKACINMNEDVDNHCFQSAIGRFLLNLYNCKIKDNDIIISFSTYRELITSGWIEHREWNGIRLSEYLSKNEEYFQGINTMEDIIERINKLKELEEVNDIFEENIKGRINKDKQKRFLSNPFRALGYNNTELFNITATYMLNVTQKLKSIINSLNTESGLIKIEEHFDLLKQTYLNKYMIDISKNGSELQKEITKRIWSVLNSHSYFPDMLGQEDIKELFNISLKLKNSDDKKEREESDFSIDQLEGIILRKKVTDKNIIYISDLSTKAHDKYIKQKYIEGRILKRKDIEDIVKFSLKNNQKELVLKGIELQNKSIKSTESYMKFIFGNLFINFKGVIEFSYIKGLRDNDSKSIILKQIESIYKNEEEVLQGLEYKDMILEKDIKDNYEKQYDTKDFLDYSDKYSDAAYRDLDFCDEKFLYSTILMPHPIYYSEFHHKLIFSGLISILKASIEESYLNLTKFLFPLFPQWVQVVKGNILSCEYPRKNIREYKYFQGINYPRSIDSMYLLRSKYVVTAKSKIRNRYNEGKLNPDKYYNEFIKEYLKEDTYNNGRHCIMCPHIYICKKGEFAIGNK